MILAYTSLFHKRENLASCIRCEEYSRWEFAPWHEIFARVSESRQMFLTFFFPKSPARTRLPVLMYSIRRVKTNAGADTLPHHILLAHCIIFNSYALYHQDLSVMVIIVKVE